MRTESNRYFIVAKRLGSFLGTLLLLILIFRGIVFFMPFFIAGIVAIVIEPLIQFCRNRLHMSRQVSSFLIITMTIFVLIGSIIWGGIFIVNQLTNVSQDLGPFISQISDTFAEEKNRWAVQLSEYLPQEVIHTILDSVTEFIYHAGDYLQNFLGKILEFVLSVPTILLHVVVAIFALIFFTKDRIYILDTMEHHFPKKWMKKMKETSRILFTTFGEYGKAYGKILFMTFSELLLSFSILKALGYELNHIFVLSAVTAIVDILPILGVGTILIPWILWQFFIGNSSFAIALLVVYGIILIIRQFLEPKMVSKQLGVHPLTTLIAMYAGFRFFGFMGLLFGPMILIILQCLFAKQLDRGLLKDLFDEK